MRAIAPPIVGLLFLATAFPVVAQDVTATLRIHGQVMVSAGGDFVSARDGQPVLAGQRILVGDGASVTVEYGRDCTRSFDTAGVHVIPPGRCDEDRDDNREDDRSRQREQSAEQGAGQGSATVSSAATPWTALATALGAVAATGALMEQQEDSPPDHPISR
ncbi:hypothetical protein QAA18_05940 [Luteimonas sp. 8-5]|uniref:hypothetical protein n=1 Tax=Luteimonas sp. 8-5 TaxID=3039387 RepID=UPI0024362EEE|nr:hypothetical protein [Luteimonas sp. 8-5]MDG6348283.1 hypothetical protein [Luteimonas sp. 8-5]